MRKSKILDITTLKFILVGFVNTIIGSGIMFAMYNIFHATYWISSASNYIIGSFVSYVLNKYWTFRSNDKKEKTIPRFIVNILVCYFLAYGIAKPAVNIMLNNSPKILQDNVSMGIGLILFTAFNYLGQRYFVFNKKN